MLYFNINTRWYTKTLHLTMVHQDQFKNRETDAQTFDHQVVIFLQLLKQISIDTAHEIHNIIASVSSGFRAEIY